MSKFATSLLSLSVRFRNADGAVLVWFALTLPVILGVAALSIDLGRQGHMHTELKWVADAAALAAAKHLDGKDDSIARANAGAQAVINSSKFADSLAGQLTLVYADSY